jgi:hypothetical protein
MQQKSIFSDWGLWLLLLFNGYAVYYYINNPQTIFTIYIIFWIQSLFIGIFNVIGMLAFTNRAGSSFNFNGKQDNKPGCTAGFFLVHYGGFHLGYFVFLIVMMGSLRKLDFAFIQLSFWAILVGCIMQFIQDKKRNATQPVNINVMFFLPYARILPMHLMILAPAFLNISAPVIFLSLKTFADIIMHIVYRKYLFKESSVV